MDMERVIGIRLEDKNEWERRVPLVPEDVKRLIQEHNIQVAVQSSPIRVFPDDEYRQAGATIEKGLSAPITFAVKEIPATLFEEDKTYIFFSHTIKGQKYNMPMLKRMMELKCNLIDYERVTDEKGRRLIFFGNYAGLAGMIDTLWALGQRLQWEGIANPFEAINHTYQYEDLQAAEKVITTVGKKIAAEGLPTELTPLIVGFAGYGNVSKGAQEILDLLPVIQISPSEIEPVVNTKRNDVHHVYKVVFKEEDLVEPIAADGQFELQDYYQHPEKYRSKMERYLPYLTAVVNCIYWTPKYPRILTKAFAKQLFSQEQPPVLKVVGDVSCDLEGAIECTVQSTKPNHPVFVYNPETGESQLGYEGKGLVIMAVDNLPCELSKESSEAFSKILADYVPAIVAADYTQSFEEVALPEPIKKAVILYHGELTEDYKYLETYL